jgi:nitrite reductase/ring-hydroxylating ferredoxin subunit
LHALGDICPHRGFVLSEGNLMEERDGTLSVVCVGHFWRFDLATGQAAFRPECVKVYAVEDEGDQIWVVDPDVDASTA